MVNPIPSDYPRVIPYLSVDGADAAIAFYATVFGASGRPRTRRRGSHQSTNCLSVGRSSGVTRGR